MAMRHADLMAYVNALSRLVARENTTKEAAEP